jgi:hypothetical protein
MSSKKVFASVPDSFHAALDSENDKAALRVISRLTSRDLLTEAALAAANAGRLAVVSAAVVSGADPNAVDEEGDSLLTIIASEGDASMMRELVLAGAVADEAMLRAALGSSSKRAVAYAVEVLGVSSAAVSTVKEEAGNQVGLEWSLPLLRGDPAPTAKTYTLHDLDDLREAIAASDRRLVDKLIVKVGEDAIGRFGFTPLSYAIDYDEELALEWLKSMHFNLAHRDHEGSTYLMAACSNSRSRVVLELIARGVDIQAEDPGGETALDAAVRAPAPGCFETAKVMLAAGARYGSQSRNRSSEGRIPAWVYRNAREEGLLPPEFADESL